MMNIHSDSDYIEWRYEANIWGKLHFLFDDQWIKFKSRCGYNEYKSTVIIRKIEEMPSNEFKKCVDTSHQLKKIKKFIELYDVPLNTNLELDNFYKKILLNAKEEKYMISPGLHDSIRRATRAIVPETIIDNQRMDVFYENLRDTVVEPVTLLSIKDIIIGYINIDMEMNNIQLQKALLDNPILDVYQSPPILIGIIKMSLILLSSRYYPLILISVLITITQVYVRNIISTEIIDIFLEVELYNSPDDVSRTLLFIIVIINLIMKIMFLLVDNDTPTDDHES